MNILSLVIDFLQSTGFSALVWENILMIAVGGLLIYLGIAKQYEPLLLVPIGFGAILVNLPLAGLLEEGGLLNYFYFGIKAGIFPPLIFLGIGAMTDFGPLLAKPQTFLLGAAAQFGIFATLIGARFLGFAFPEAASIAIIGGADGHLPDLQAGGPSAGTHRRGRLLLYGPGTHHPAPDHPRFDHQEGAGHRHVGDQACS